MNKESERNFSLTANWPLNQLCLLRYANDREAERWLKLPFNSTVHCFTFNKEKKKEKDLPADEGELLILITVPKVTISYHQDVSSSFLSVLFPVLYMIQFSSIQFHLFIQPTIGNGKFLLRVFIISI